MITQVTDKQAGHLTSLQSDALRIATFLATVMVVLRHCFNLHRFYTGGNPWMPITDANIAVQHFVSEWTNVAIPSFFFMSGYLFFRDVQFLGDCIPKWRKRIQTLLVPYLLWNLLLIILLICLYARPALRTQLQESFDIRVSIGWFLDRLTLHPVMGHFWYIRTLMLFLLCAPVIYLLLQNYALSFIVLFILARWWRPIDTGILSSEGALYFFCGCWLAIHGGLPDVMPFKHWIWIILIVLYNYFIPYFFPNCITIPGGIAMTMYVGWQICLLLAKSPVMKRKILSLNRHSFFLFALHSLFVRFINLLASHHLSHTPLNSFLAYCFTFVSALTICLLVSAVSRKCTPRFYSILTGGR